MCTCLTYENGDFYFGRNLDLEYAFGEQVVVVPRNYELAFQTMPLMKHHYAMIGMASSAAEYPLYAEAVNEKGLGMAGLNFPGNACYKEEQEGKKNVAPYELIPWILGQCATVREARELLKDVNVLKKPYAEHLPLSPLHWMISDREQSIVMEAVEEGVFLYENPFGVLTNNPPFPFYQMYMNHYLNLTSSAPESRFAEQLSLKTYGQGMGAMGLPGDFSPASRFVKAAFLKWNAHAAKEEEASVAQFFHMMDGIAMVRGAVRTPEGRDDITTYSCCVNADKGIYYYKTYENNQIQAVDLHHEDLEGEKPVVYELVQKQQIHWQN